MDKSSENHDFSYSEAKELMNKLEGWMRTTNETLKTLVMRTENFRVDISNLDSRIKKLEKNNGSIIIRR